MANLSEAARAALLNVGTNRQGATIGAHTPPVVRSELERAGLIGAGDGLTRKGTIQRQRLQSALEEALF